MLDFRKHCAGPGVYFSHLLLAEGEGSKGSVAQPSIYKAWRESSSWSERSKTLLGPGSEDKRGRGAPFWGRDPCDGL